MVAVSEAVAVCISGLDVACGRGRNARLLQSIGCRVICADIDRSALGTVAQESHGFLGEEKRVGTRPGDHASLPIVVDLQDQSWPFVECSPFRLLTAGT
jgi:SAM-dependent methyltransferase